VQNTIELARSVIAGDQHLTIQLLRDIDSRRERGIVSFGHKHRRLWSPPSLRRLLTRSLRRLPKSVYSS
jgi:hypothetical protein